MTKPDSVVFKFVESDSGLYYLDSAEPATVLVNTVADNKSSYTNDDYLRAVRARETQIKIGRPSTKDYIRIVTSNLLPNCPVTKADILAAEHLFGPDVGSLKGKTVRRKPHAVREVVERLPPTILSRYRDVTLCVDVMHVNGVPMLVSVSRNIRFGTVEPLPNRRSATILKGIDAIRRLYYRGGFRITSALMDGEFTPMRGDLADRHIALNETGRDEHVGEIERYIRTLKERMRAYYNTLPFNRVPARLVIEMAKAGVYWLNAFPHKRGISATASPREIVTGQKVDFNRHCKYQFGEYVQTHEQHDNSMAPRTIGALALRPTGNAQGNYYFMSLSTGHVINRVHATSLPMPDDVIDRVHAFARQQQANPGLVFTDRNQMAHDFDDNDMSDNESHDPRIHEYAADDNDDDDDDSEYNDHGDESEDDLDPDQYDDEDDLNADELEHDYSEAAAQYLSENENNVGEPADMGHDDSSDYNESATAGNHDDEIAGVGPMDDESTGVGQPDEMVDGEDVGSINDEDGDAEAMQDAHEMDARYGPRSQHYNLRPRKERDYSHLHATDGDGAPLATPQMSMKKGLKEFGEAGVDAVRKEMQQLHDRKVMAAKKPTELTHEQKKEALAYLMFLKRKRCGKIKGRGCADGRKQRAYISREEASSPTVSTEAVFLTAIIDAMENREVAVVDVPGAFMQADMDEEVHVKFTGRMVDLLLEIDHEMYEPCVTYERGEKVMYVELLKALYGTLRAARLFWEKLSAKLQEWGFQLNPYDTCVANKQVCGKQLTVAWHVDDLKISHVDVGMVDDFIAQLEEEFGKETPLNKSRGKVHDYLGMILDFTNPGEVSVSMVDYIKTILHDMPQDMVGKAATPAAGHLFTVNEVDPVLLDKEHAETFVHMVMQLLYLSQRARPDIRTAVSFLCGRLQQPDGDDYKKLARVVKYLQATIDLPLVLSGDKGKGVRWWVDASFAVHPDMKGHTGGTMSLGKGSAYSTSSKQKLVSRSSTESEVIGVYDVMPQVLWTGHFLGAQGIDVTDTILYQDNMSSILLEKNGRSSSTKRTRHMNIRYFFVKDQVDSKTVKIEHCPTGDMLADFFTKPLQGHLFRKLRDQIMNIDSSSAYHSSHRSVLSVQEERMLSPT